MSSSAWRSCWRCVERARDAPGILPGPARDLTAARPNCKSRSAPYRKPHGSRRETDRTPDGSRRPEHNQAPTGSRKGTFNCDPDSRRTLSVMTPAGVYTEDMPNGRRFKWTRPVPGQSPVLTRAACGRVPTGSYSSAGQLSGPWRVPGGIPTGSSQYTSSKEYTEVGDAAFSATCKQLTSPSEIEIGDNLQVGLLALVAEEERQAELAGAGSAARRVPGSEVTASLRRISPNGARSVFNSELKSIRRPRGAKNRPAAVGKPAGLRPGRCHCALTALSLRSLCDLKLIGARRECCESTEVAMFCILYIYNIGAAVRSYGARSALSRRSHGVLTALSRRSHGAHCCIAVLGTLTAME
ncbi:hypothetical protein Bbelb_359190 [Branchiostoma belcheri]|nr:hypothetical protein Bbelb_359190 [Branchiostoma belcheri]